MEDGDRTDSNHPVFTFEDSVAHMPASESCKKEESLKSQNQSVSSIPYHKSEGHASEAESPDKDENVLIEDDISNLESCRSSLEHEEVSDVKKDEDGMEASNVCEANYIIIVIYS